MAQLGAEYLYIEGFLYAGNSVFINRIVFFHLKTIDSTSTFVQEILQSFQVLEAEESIRA